jgi:hypothetical protein
MLPLQISHTQLGALDRAADDLFIDRLLDIFEVDISDAARQEYSRSLFRARLLKARQMGLHTEYEVAAFVECCEAYGEGFIADPGHPATRILLKQDTGNEAKADALLALVESAEEHVPPMRPESPVE